MFSPITYSNRRDELRKSMSGGIILLLGNDEVGINYSGNVYPFRQDSTFLYYFGLSQPGLAALIDCDTGDDIIFGNEATVNDIVWTGPQTSLKDRAASVGVSYVKPFDAIDEILVKGTLIHYLKPYRYQHQIRMAQALNCGPAQVMDIASIELTQRIIQQRSIKDVEEIAELDDAVSLTTQMHLTAMKLARPGLTERDVMSAIVKVALAGGSGTSFPPIVTVRGEVLHNQTFDNLLQDGQLLLVDCGAENALHYSGDMTRTFPISGTFSQKQKDIYEIVLSAEKEASASIKPGKAFVENHLQAATIIAEGLINLGLMKGNAEDAVAAGAHGLFFPHGLGHMMGLDVHDMENLGEDLVGYDQSTQRSEQFGTSYLRLGKNLNSGNVLTVEPGIYFIRTLASLWKKDGKHMDFINYDKFEEYSDFGGIRIEENFLVTTEGSRVLGDPLPKEVAEIESIRTS